MEPIPLHHVWQYTDVDRAFWEEHLEDWLPERLFDAHTHVNEPEFFVDRPSAAKRRQYWVNEVLEPIGAEAAARCHRTIFPKRKVCSVAFGIPSLEFDISASNASLAEACQRYGWYRLAVVGPDWSVERVAAELDRPRTLGVKPYYSLIPGQDPDSRDKFQEASIFEFLPHAHLELLNDRKAWVTLHVPKADRLGHAANIAEIRQIRERYPRVALVIAHLGRCYTLPQAEESLPQLADDPGLYFDNSAVLNPEVHRFALETLGPHRVLYGTDNPIFYMRGRRQWHGRSYVNRTSYPFHFNKDREPPEIEAGYTLYAYEALRALRCACDELGLAASEVAAILHDNAARLVVDASA